MMLNNVEYETVYDFMPCPTHAENPSAWWPGCTCSGSMSQRPVREPNEASRRAIEQMRTGKMNTVSLDELRSRWT